MKQPKRKQKTEKKYDSLVIVFVILFVLLVIFSGILFSMRHSDASILLSPKYDVRSECSLSLCDCTCYRTENLPEVKEQKLCSNDCRGLFGISSCELVNESCIPTFVKK